MQQQPGFPQQAPYPPPPTEKAKSGFPTWLIILLAAIGLVVVLGAILIALAAAGMSKYISSAKTAEAKATVGSISRAAVAAYDRESLSLDATEGAAFSHRLCETASPVPATLASVRGTQYTPSSSPGMDFDSGSETAGWKCLRFSVTTPMRYRYQYTQGSGYLVPSIAPGPSGFEASAQGDIDGDGAPSTFALTGTPGPGDSIKVGASIYTENDQE